MGVGGGKESLMVQLSLKDLEGGNYLTPPIVPILLTNKLVSASV